MFKLFVIQAEFGDSLLLEYGNGTSKFILIDGGPAGVYENSLRTTLENLVSNHGILDTVIVTHIDIDHIKGILDLLAELKGQQDNSEELFLKIGNLWLNTFSKTIDTNGSISHRINSIFSTAAGNGVQMASTAIAINGIKEGNKVTTLCNILNIPINAPTSQSIFRVGSPDNPVVVGNLDFTIVGPTKENLDELQKEWEEWLEQRENEMADGNFSILSMSDKSIPNLSSIMFLVKGNGRTILFTGDGRGDHLIQGLKKEGLLQNGKLHIDVLKVPHHGSDRNVNRSFFENITADTYVISANGKHNNPDYATLTWIVEAAKDVGRQIRLVITNETASTKKLLNDYEPGEWGYSIDFIPENELFLEV